MLQEHHHFLLDLFLLIEVFEEPFLIFLPHKRVKQLLHVKLILVLVGIGQLMISLD